MRVVLVDVLVSTTKGEPVSGLLKDEFQVFEEGTPQTVTSFEEHKGDGPVVETKLPPMPPNVWTNYPTINPPDSVNVLLLDWLNTQPQDQAFVHAQAVQYLKQVSPGTRLAIFTLGTQLRMVHGFTDELSGLVSAFDGNKAARTQVSPLMPTTRGEGCRAEAYRSHGDEPCRAVSYRGGKAGDGSHLCIQHRHKDDGHIEGVKGTRAISFTHSGAQECDLDRGFFSGQHFPDP